MKSNIRMAIWYIPPPALRGLCGLHTRSLSMLRANGSGCNPLDRLDTAKIHRSCINWHLREGKRRACVAAERGNRRRSAGDPWRILKFCRDRPGARSAKASPAGSTVQSGGASLCSERMPDAKSPDHLESRDIRMLSISSEVLGGPQESIRAFQISSVSAILPAVASP